MTWSRGASTVGIWLLALAVGAVGGESGRAPGAADEKPAPAAATSPQGVVEPPATRADWRGLPVVRNGAAEGTIERALDGRSGIAVDEKPLREVLWDISNRHKVRIQLDARSLADASVLPDAPVSLSAPEISLRSALNRLLEPLELDWVIRDEMVVVSTQEKCGQMLQARVYEVADVSYRVQPNGDLEIDAESLVRTIRGNVSPTTWDDVGGPGSISVVPRGKVDVLVVTQTRAVHEQIAALLDTLRQTRNTTDLAPAGATIRRAAPGSPRENPSAPSVPAGAPSAPEPVDRAGEGTARANNSAAVKLFRLLADKPNDNFVFSPYCISSALAMVLGGARGETASQLAKVLQLPAHDDRVHGGQQSLRRSILADGRSKQVELYLASRLWARQGIEYREEYSKLLTERYDADVATMDFSAAAETATLINRWTSDRTRGQIPGIVTAEAIGRDTAILLTGATYFKGQWQRSFPVAATTPAEFAAPKGIVKVSMMHVRDRFAYYEAPGVQIVSLPYLGGTFSLLTLLPSRAQGARESLESLLSGEQVSAWRARLVRQDVDVHLPRFRCESDCLANEALIRLGAHDLFDVEKADLSGITTTKGASRIYVDRVLHRAILEVNEEGTEGAAATAVVGFFGGRAESPKPREFRADHPFMVALCHEPTGAILFLGRVTHPQATAD